MCTVTAVVRWCFSLKRVQSIGKRLYFVEICLYARRQWGEVEECT